MNWKKAIFAVLAALCILCGLPGTVSAHEVPDLNRKGSVTVEMEYAGKPVKDGTLKLYRVGDIQEKDGNYSFALTQDFAGSGADLSDISSAELAQTLADYARPRKITGQWATVGTDGKAMFSKLDPGLYLIVQTKASTGFESINPFLVSVPYNVNGEYKYDITAQSKTELHQEPTPTIPMDPTLPQTGQLNWPVPVLAALGLGLMLLGLALRSGKKEPTDEA